MTYRPLYRRPGAALMMVVVILMIFSVLMVSITWKLVTHHRMLEHRSQQQQSLWLARSGLEMAAARLLADPKYRGQTMEPVPLGEVRVTVVPDKKSPDVYQVTSEARFPKDLREPVVRELTRRYRRVADGSTIKLVAMP
jgi:hypothetical protein